VTVEVHVRRKIRDLVRDAAEDALRERWPGLARVDRAEAWSFTLSAGGADLVRRVLEGTTLVANPNVHRWTLAAEGDAAAQAGPGPGSARIRVAVRDRVDAKGASVLRSLRERLGWRDVAGVRRSVLWTIDLPASREEAERLLRELTGEGGQGAGLLANPHAQEVEATVTA
jgi:phosphoribosylformylglycinamidine (FGAM) synthase PurS component